MAITIAKSDASAIRLRVFMSMLLLVIERFDNEFLGDLMEDKSQRQVK
jgi:hypothetical protein